MTLEFDEEAGGNGSHNRLLYAKFQKSSQAPFMVTFLINRHIVKNEDSARRLLLIITIIIFVISIYLILKGTSGPVFIDTLKK